MGMSANSPLKELENDFMCYRFKRSPQSKPYSMNRITKINISWALLLVSGIGSFVFAKSIIDKQRYNHMKSRERMKNANTGDYEQSHRKFT